jgi:octaprenyl-diphosphate synthase
MIKVYSPQDFPAYLPKLNSLYDDLFAKGKGFRSLLVSQICEGLSVPKETQRLLCQTIEFIHNSSLLHDDLIDGAELRRGKLAAWKKYSPDYAVLAGDYLLARVMVNLSSYGEVKLIHYTANMISDLVEGEWLQDSIIHDYFVSPDQLDRIHQLKTASLFKWCLRAPLIAVQNFDQSTHDLLEEMGNLLGLLFQRSDDLLDYNIRNHEGKAPLGDLKSGYLNSFGAFVAAGMDNVQIDRLVKSSHLDEFVLATGSKEIFTDKLKAFDEMNQRLIDVYMECCRQLSSPFPEALVNQLKLLPDFLYWRKQK